MRKRPAVIFVLSLILFLLLIFSTKTYYAYSNETATLPATYYTSRIVNDQGAFTVYAVFFSSNIKINGNDYNFQPRYITISGKKYPFSTRVCGGCGTYGAIEYTARGFPETITVDGFTLSFTTYSTIMAKVPKVTNTGVYYIIMGFVLCSMIGGLLAMFVENDEDENAAVFVLSIILFLAFVFYIISYIP